VGYVVNLAAFAGAVALGVDAYAALIPAFLGNTWSNYELNRRFTFRSRSARGGEATRYFVVGLACLITNYTTFHVLFSLVGIPAIPAQAMAVILGLPVGFFGSKLWAFAR